MAQDPIAGTAGSVVFRLQMLRVSVALPSGQAETFSLERSSKVGDLRVLAQKSFQTWLLETCGCQTIAWWILQWSLQAAGLEDGDHLTAIALEAKVAATDRAFALFCPGGGKVVTWGDPN